MVKKCWSLGLWLQEKHQFHQSMELTDWELTLYLTWLFLEEQPPVPPNNFINLANPSPNCLKMQENNQ